MDSIRHYLALPLHFTGSHTNIFSLLLPASRETTKRSYITIGDIWSFFMDGERNAGNFSLGEYLLNIREKSSTRLRVGQLAQELN
jgi:hypothetical protein